MLLTIYIGGPYDHLKEGAVSQVWITVGWTDKFSSSKCTVVIITCHPTQEKSSEIMEDSRFSSVVEYLLNTQSILQWEYIRNPGQHPSDLASWVGSPTGEMKDVEVWLVSVLNGGTLWTGPECDEYKFLKMTFVWITFSSLRQNSV